MPTAAKLCSRGGRVRNGHPHRCSSANVSCSDFGPNLKRNMVLQSFNSIFENCLFFRRFSSTDNGRTQSRANCTPRVPERGGVVYTGSPATLFPTDLNIDL